MASRKPSLGLENGPRRCNLSDPCYSLPFTPHRNLKGSNDVSTIQIDATFLATLDELAWHLYALAGEEALREQRRVVEPAGSPPERSGGGIEAAAVLELACGCAAPEAGEADVEPWVISPAVPDAACCPADLDREQILRGSFSQGF